jgi:PPOX class probable F420-dependent enzyme
MSAKEITRYLSKRHIAKLSTVNPDVSPQVSPVWFYFDSKEILIATYRESLKVRNVRKNSKVSVLIDSSIDGWKLQGVLIQGRAELIEGAECKRIEKMVYDKYLPQTVTAKDKVAADFKRFATGESNSSICIRIVPETLSSWDYIRMTSKDVLDPSGEAYERHDASEVFGVN